MPELGRRRIQDADHDLFTEHSVGKRRDAEVDGLGAELGASCAHPEERRRSAMSKREITLMRDDSLSLMGNGRLGDLTQLTVHAKPHAVMELVGLEVEVGRTKVDGVDQHLLQEPNDRRVLDFGECPVRLSFLSVSSSAMSKSMSPEVMLSSDSETDAAEPL